MKDKENFYKIVYHFIHGNLYKTLKTDRSFHIDFPRVHALFTIDHSTNVEIFDNKHNSVKIWKDKHGNIIVRYHLPNKQTKIDF